MEEAIAIVTKYRDNVSGNNACCRIQRAVLNSIIEDMQQRLTTLAVDLPVLAECKECFGVGGFHSDNCSRNPASR